MEDKKTWKTKPMIVEGIVDAEVEVQDWFASNVSPCLKQLATGRVFGESPGGDNATASTDRVFVRIYITLSSCSPTKPKLSTAHRPVLRRLRGRWLAIHTMSRTGELLLREKKN